MTSGYSGTAMDHFNHPRHVGPLPNAQARGTQGTPGAGNYMVIELAFSDGRINAIAFQTYGCPGAICCGSMVTDLALGKTLAEARAIAPEHVLAALGGIPLGKHSCARLATGALAAALDQLGTTGTASPTTPTP